LVRDGIGVDDGDAARSNSRPTALLPLPMPPVSPTTKLIVGQSVTAASACGAIRRGSCCNRLAAGAAQLDAGLDRRLVAGIDARRLDAALVEPAEIRAPPASPGRRPSTISWRPPSSATVSCCSTPKRLSSAAFFSAAARLGRSVISTR
jgi:hypothetical protein